MNFSTPTHRDRERRDEEKEEEEEEEVVNRPDSRASGKFDATVRFSPLNPFRLHSRAEPCGYASLDSVARRIAAARTRLYVPASQASLFKALHPSQPDSPAGLARREPVSHAARQPNQPIVLSAHALAGSSARRFSAPSKPTRLSIAPPDLRVRATACRTFAAAAAERVAPCADSPDSCGPCRNLFSAAAHATCFGARHEVPVDTGCTTSTDARRVVPVGSGRAGRAVPVDTGCTTSDDARRVVSVETGCTTSAYARCAVPVGSGRAGRADARRAVPVDTGCTTSADARCAVPVGSGHAGRAVPVDTGCTTSADARCAVPVGSGRASRADNCIDELVK